VTDLITLSDDEILQAARQAEASGAEAFGLVNSGLGPTDEEIDALAPVVQRLRAETNMRVCASLGILSPQQAHKLARMGVERYNHNLQTSAHHYKNICHTHSYADRLATLTHLREAGIKVCSGALFGMGETWTDRIELAIELRKHDPAIVPVNFLIPIAGTPLADVTPMTPMECLKAIALYRFMLPKQQITVAGGREVNLRDLQSWVFLAGADGFLVGNYLTTCGRDSQQDQNMLRDLNLTIASSPRPTSIDEPTASKSHAS
jgi:biotin synthase